MTGTMIIDNHPLTRTGTRTVIESTDGFSACAISRAQAMAEVQRQRPEVVLLETDPQGGDGLALLARLLRLPDPPRVAVLATSATDASAVAALRMGAAGVLLRDIEREGLVASVRALATGSTVLSAALVEQITAMLIEQESRTTGEARAKQLVATLSERERQILQMVTNGLSNGEIGCRLFLGTATVKEHVSAILAKLRVKNRLQAALLGYRAGLLSEDDPGA